MIAGLTECCGL